jgi:hypothetical protein
VSAGYGYSPDDDPEEQRRRNPALALDPQQPPALSDPALALAPEQRGGAAPTNALALDQDQVDAVSGPLGGGPEPQPAAMPGGELTPDQLALASTVPPNPAGDQVDQTLAANPIPPKPPEASATGKPPTIQEQERAGMTERDRLTEQSVQAEQKAHEARAKAAEATQAQADTEARIAQEHAQHQQEIVNQANARTQAWMDSAQGAAAKYSQMGLHDYWQDKSTFNKVLAKLSVLTGSLAGKENPGLNMLNQDIERDFRMQQAAILKQKENVEMARGGVQDSLTFKQQALADNNLKKAAAYDAAAAQAVALKMRAGVPLEQAQTDANVIALRQKANDTRMETLKVVHQQNLQDAQLGQGEERLGIERTRANAAMLAAQSRGHKGRGGAGGGGGGRADALGQFVEAAGALEKGQPITPQVAQLGLRAGLKPNQIAAEVDRYRGSGAKSAKGAGGGEKQITDDFKTFREQTVGTTKSAGPGKVLGTIEGVRNSMEEAIASKDKGRLKAATVKAMEQAGALMSGGKLTNAQIQILHELQSAQDAMVAKIGYWTGEPQSGRGLVKRLMDLIDSAGNEQLGLVSKAREGAYGQMLGPGGTADTPEKKRRFLNLAKGTWSQLTWKGQHPFNEPGGAGVGGAKLSDRDRALKVKAEQAVNDPNGDPATKRDAQALLDKLEEMGD